LTISPQTAYARFVNRTTTTKAGTHDSVHIASDATNGDGTHTVTFSGNVAADSRPTLAGYRVPQPSRFAEIVLAEALHERGIVAAARDVDHRPDIAKLSPSDTADPVVAERAAPR